VDVFPLADVRYTYRSDFDQRRHKGVDLFAPRGTPVLAVSAGKAEAKIDPKGGKVVYLTGDDGRRWYYAHLDQWEAPPLRFGAAVPVAAGDLLGSVGNTGNAKGTRPHLHFQMWDPKVGLVDPYHVLREIDPHTDSDLPDLEVTPVPKKRKTNGNLGIALLALIGLWAMRKKR